MVAPDKSEGREAAVCANCGKPECEHYEERRFCWNVLAVSTQGKDGSVRFQPAPAAPPPAARPLGVFDGPECVRCGRREAWHPDGSCHVFGAPVAAAPSGANDNRVAKIAARLAAFDAAAHSHPFGDPHRKAESALRFMAISDIRYLLARLADVERERDRYRDAVEFYASADEDDGGKHARAALASISPPHAS